MKQNTAIIVASILLSMCFVIFPRQTGKGELHSGAAGTNAEKKIVAVLDRMIKSHETYLSVLVEDRKALRLLTEAIGAKNVVEIGTATGYSGLWLCLALEKRNGHLTTFDIDHQRASMAQEHFKEAGVEKMVTIVEGDAHEQVAKLKGPIDLVFIDADKSGYVDYLNKLLPIVQQGGLILAHNVDMVPGYVKAVTTSEDLETIFYMEGGGLSVTLKKRT
jgi:caffeoyl-CoA O-methyltransferase